MPELPDIMAYVEAIRRFALGAEVNRVRVFKPFLVRSINPSTREVEGKKLTSVDHMGKRVVLEFEKELYFLIHLMIAGRFLWLSKPISKPGKPDLAEIEFTSGCLLLTEAGSKRRASLFVVKGAAELAEFDRGGLAVLDSTLAQFEEALQKENRTLKRALTNPLVFSGIGNAYSDEILFQAKLSPVRLSRSLNPQETERLWVATKQCLNYWIEKLRAEFKDKFPGRGQVTAFREDFYVHGRYRMPCRICGSPIQRIVHAENETNYCAQCQNEGRLLADRALSRLLKDDWPRTLEELVSE